MNIKTLQEALKVLECLDVESPSTRPSTSDHPHVIVRGDRSGVFFGRLASQDGQTVELTECRHVWYWSGAANTAEMALTGVSKPNDCKIVAPVGRIRILDAIEVLFCTDEAVVSLTAVPAWSKS